MVEGGLEWQSGPTILPACPDAFAMPLTRACLVFAFLLVPAGLISAQDAEKKVDEKPAEAATTPSGPLPGHSQHGEVFNEGPRQQAYLMPGMPKIQFPTSTKSAEAQKFIEQVMGQIHGFWYY